METLNYLAARISADRAEAFLVELLNSDLGSEFIPGDPKRAARLWERFNDLLPKNLRIGAKPYEPIVIAAVGSGKEISAGCLKALRRARLFLAAAWRAPSALVREVFLFRLIGLYMQGDDPDFLFRGGYATEDVDEDARRGIDGFCLVLIRAFHALDRMRYCLNPECPAPYFFAKKRRQRYCTEECAGAGQRELKRVWWAEHGDAWRKAREASSKKSRRIRGK
jgi:hypothetical protein